MKIKWYLLVGVGMLAVTSGCTKLKTDSSVESRKPSEKLSVVAPGAKIRKLATGYDHLEGPAVDANGDIYFTQQRKNKIFKWLVEEKKVELFHDNTGASNGMFVDHDGNLIACAGDFHKLVSFDMDGNMTVLTGSYNGKPYNCTNDLWIDLKGGIYFTDPHYGRREKKMQDGEHVYYLSPDRKNVIRVIEDMVRPNGIIGSPDGSLLYVADEGADTTWVYTILPDGTLTNKKFFADEADDGMSVDIEGNIYLTPHTIYSISVYGPDGNKIETIETPEQPRNLCFGGKDRQTLFITATTSLYSLRMRVKGL
ncbi:SMP-30/gluconolactonase/LRE family protein [Candidatus Latescibacterota bacterium]